MITDFMPAETKDATELWGCFKDGRPKAFGKSKKDLLIGYDMMPLRGLDVTERAMKAEGYVFARARVERCEWGQEHGFAPMTNGAFDPEIVAWGAFTGSDAGVEIGGAWAVTLRSTIGYLHCQMKALPFWMFGLSDCRRWSTFEKKLREAFEAFDAHGIEIVPVRAEPIMRRNRGAALRQFERMVPGAFPAAPFPRD